MSNIAVKGENINKKYPLYESDFDRLKGFFNTSYKPKEFEALKDVSFEINKGEIVGIIGVNGSGKSTLSNIIAGITYPTTGEIEVNGSVNILSANAGMENNLTGIENIKFKCTLLGFSNKEIDEIQESIIDFADIGVHINQPMRTYSSGMRSRLGFAISIHMNPDILIIDEGLAVGDSSFYEKCIAKMNEIRNRGKTVIYISHSVQSMNEFCDKIMWIHKGKILGIEEPNNIILPYCGFAREFGGMTNNDRQNHMPILEHYKEKYL